MGFGEAGQNKSVSVIETDGKNLVSVKEIPVPVFQRLERISGDMNELENEINTLGHENESIWLDVTYTGEDIQGNLQDKLNNCVKKFPLIDILSVREESPKDNPDGISVPDGLDSITPLDMLKFCFDENDTPKEQRDILVPLYEEILRGLEVDY